ncbi:GNAT family N-acetyltransferase [Nocardioides panacisoli]|uniref:N-acetyltransferase domain-containing protein n=1 Tax=Nocardioides panacisoli TaxID=627624 RepID=A0ABP7IB56_9ACTN
MTVTGIPHEVRVGDPDDHAPLVDLWLARIPSLRRSEAEFGFVNRDKARYFHLRTAYVGEDLAGWGISAHPSMFPPDFALVNVVVAREHAGRGIGRALYDELLTTVPAAITLLGTAVADDDPESRAIAEAHGFAVTQHGINSELRLVDLPEPVPVPGLTYEDVSDLVFPDEDAVEAMLQDSQTNPEAAAGIRQSLPMFRRFQETQDFLAVLARLDGAPAAIITGDIDDGVLSIHYTGVGQSFRGRNIGLALKQYAHRLAAERGATASYTTNEEGNAGIRRVNAKLGYEIVGGAYRMRRAFP